MDQLLQEINGDNNVVEIGTLGRLQASSIKIKGNRNRVVIDDGVWLRGLHILVESDENVIHIGENAKVTGRFIQKISPNNSISIGKDTSIGQASIINGEGTSVKIGEDCMFAFGIELRSTDSHAIIDTESGNRLNIAGDIVIGDHVWLGAHVVVLKNVHIGSNSIVGIRSVVVSKFPEEGILLSGVPAKPIRHGVTWQRPLLG